MNATQLEYDGISYDAATAPPTLVLADGPRSREMALEAVSLAGGRLVGCASLSEADALARPALLRAVLIELGDATPTAIDDALLRVDSLVRDNHVQAVVCFNDAQTDHVTARIFGSHVTLLCEPTLIDRVAALAVAGRRPDAAYNDVHDESEKLRVLNAEVARIAETLARLTQQERAPPARTGIADATVKYQPEPGLTGAKVAAGDVRTAIRARRMRANYFGGDLFADPAWDMLLDLFAADLEHRRVSVSSLCIAAAVPGTTALRWIGTMVEEHLFERQADPLDRRRAYISLSAKAREAMTQYFLELRRLGVASA